MQEDDIVGKILQELISQSSPNISLSELYTKFPPEVVNTTLVMLKPFNIFTSDSEGQLSFSNEHSRNLLRSLAVYISGNLPVIANWDSSGSKHNARANEVLQNGLQLVYELENRRVTQLRSKEILDDKEVFLIVVKAKLEEKEEPYFLFQYSMKASKYQLIGGYKLSEDSDFDSTIERLLKKELGLNELKDYKVNEVYKQTALKVSSRTGLYSKFTVTLCQLEIDKTVLKLTNRDRWFSLEDMKREYSSDGKYIMSPLNTDSEDREKVEKILSEMALSTEQVQPVKEENYLEDESKKTQSVIKTLLTEEESEKLEFKSTIRWDIVQNKVNKVLEKVILKTIAAFMNSNGGDLIIGLDDNKVVLGLENDINTLRKKNEDGLMLHLISLISDSIGVEYNAYVHISFHKSDEKTLCLVNVNKTMEPVFLKDGELREFYVRTGNSSKALNPLETYKYISLHW